jgi:hypothetical protein
MAGLFEPPVHIGVTVHARPSPPVAFGACSVPGEGREGRHIGHEVGAGDPAVLDGELLGHPNGPVPAGGVIQLEADVVLIGLGDHGDRGVPGKGAAGKERVAPVDPQVAGRKTEGRCEERGHGVAVARGPGVVIAACHLLG